MDKENDDPLTILIKQNLVDKVVEFLDAHNDPELVNKAFILACEYGRFYIIKKLKLGRYSKWKDAFSKACGYGNIEIINYIYEHWHFYLSGNDIVDCLAYACIDGHINVIKWFFENHNDFYFNNFKNTLLGFSCEFGNNKELIDYLIEKGANDLNYGLEEASRYGCLENVKYMVEKGASRYNDALFYALEYLITLTENDRGYICETVSVIFFLISRGAEINWEFSSDKAMFITAMDVLYGLTTFKTYEKRLMNINNTDLLIDYTNNDIVDNIQKYF